MRNPRRLGPFALLLLSIAILAALPVETAAQWGPYGPYGPRGPYGPGGPYGPRYRDEYSAALRLEVKPRQAEVYVDGYRAGIVDEFDGMFQRLRLTPGGHEIVLYLDGYRAVHEKIYSEPFSDRTLKLTMAKLGDGEAAEPRPVPSEQPARPEPSYPPRRGGGPPPAAEPAQFGSLAIRVVPVNAEIFIDGQRWRIGNALAPVSIRLSAGRHTVKVVKDGYESYSGDVDIRAGETETLNVSLKRLGL